MSVQVPSKAVSTADDVLSPTKRLLNGISLLGGETDGDKASDGDGFGSVWGGPPQSVALIEAGATAAAKWWGAGLSGAVVAAWAAVGTFWGDNPDVHTALVTGAAIVTAALILAIGYLIASDVRGRAQAAAATIDARSKVAVAMLDAEETVYRRPPATYEPELVALSPSRGVVNRKAPPGEEPGWEAVALQRTVDADAPIQRIPGFWHSLLRMPP